ncbi:transglutaminase-like domain-containing protein [Crocosphaera sp. Alani8]|uniref:transglutaminase-like domain-containing protein n=1 Tax=Crocosphaera sp. Alani8 TaxID=3038952 RepID=UPI00313D5C99
MLSLVNKQHFPQNIASKFSNILINKTYNSNGLGYIPWDFVTMLIFETLSSGFDITDKMLGVEVAVFMAIYMKEYLKVSEVINWQDSEIMKRAKQIASEYKTRMKIAKASFEWVRDEIFHSVDYQMNPVTWRASDVLKHKTGYCYAKSHLLAALLRANQIPTGFCYQRLSIDDNGAPYSLHGFNAIYLPKIGWYRVDARGNKEGVDAQFLPPQERLAFKIQFAEEADFQTILAEPLSIVIEALRSQVTWDEMLRNLPDISLESAKNKGLKVNLN